MVSTLLRPRIAQCRSGPRRSWRRQVAGAGRVDGGASGARRDGAATGAAPAIGCRHAGKRSPPRRRRRPGLPPCACSKSGPKSSGAPPMTVLESPTMTSSFLAREMATLTRFGSFKNPIAARSFERTRERITPSDSRPSKASTDSMSSGGTMPLRADTRLPTCECVHGDDGELCLADPRRMIDVMSLQSATSNSLATDR